MDEVEIINQRKRWKMADRKSATITGAKIGTKAASKAPRNGYHLFLREQLDEMTGEG